MPPYFSQTVIDMFAASGLDTRDMVAIQAMPPRVVKLDLRATDYTVVRGRKVTYRPKKWKRRK